MIVFKSQGYNKWLLSKMWQKCVEICWTDLLQITSHNLLEVVNSYLLMSTQNYVMYFVLNIFFFSKWHKCISLIRTVSSLNDTSPYCFE